jgi:cytochrome P450
MAAAVNKETGEAFTETDAVCQAFSFVMAATETATAAMAFAIHLLATHPEAEAKVLAEVDAFGRNATPSFQDLHERFPYIEAVFKESLRMYPPVPLTIREAERELSLGQYAVPAGTYLAVSVYGLQRDPRYWPDPDVFRPERFLQGGDASKEAYMPFGEGTRSCVGQRYAWQEAVLAFVRIYQRTALRLDVKRGKELDVRMSLGLVPRKGVHVQVMLRP